MKLNDQKPGFSPCKADFPGLANIVWLNAAHQGPMPMPAIAASHDAIALKSNPSLITDDLFSTVPDQLRSALAKVIGANAEDIVLANSASYGLHLIAHSFKWRHGDEIVAISGDFPSTGLPWMLLERQGVKVRFIETKGLVVTAEEIERALSNNTRIVAITWVHSFTGGVADLDAIGDVCRRHRVRLVVNGSQGVGAKRIHVKKTPIDAMTSVGFKFLCGPYATGFLWLRPGAWPELEPTKAYWLSLMNTEDLSGPIRLPEPPKHFRPSDHDIFCTANFNNYLPWLRSLEYLLDIGFSNIEEQSRALYESLVKAIDPGRYRIMGNPADRTQSNLVFLAPVKGRAACAIVAGLSRRQIYVSERRGQIRVSFHFYNSIEDIYCFAEAVNRLRLKGAKVMGPR
jgi:selenocysteine lyase/cysteine desulfurase